MMDPEDERPFDPREMERNTDRLAQLIQQGRNAEALEFCTHLEKSGSISLQAIETMVHRLYDETLDSIGRSPFLREIRQWREQKQLAHAETQLQQLLSRQPDNWAATLLLARIYAEDFGQPNRALALIQPADKPPTLPRQFMKFARQSIREWGEAAGKQAQLQREKERAANLPEPVAKEISIDDLLKSGQLATAIEHMENALKEQPQDAELWLKLAEAHALYCADFGRADKVLRQMEISGKFRADEVETAKAKLKEWKMARLAK